jgi:hypothetical protein
MNSHSTQVAQLQFEYLYELDKVCLVGQGMCWVKWFVNIDPSRLQCNDNNPGLGIGINRV